jgi:O-succinylbenzoate synthase
VTDTFPIEPIYVHRYTLRSAMALNSASHRREFPGALIRCGDGFGCIHPWPEFGDDSLETQLSLLSEGHPTPLSQSALDCCVIDGNARRAGVSLFEGLTVPQSHYSWSFGQDTDPQIARVLSEGWPAIKAKGFANWGETLRFLECVGRAAGEQPLKLRVDFNGCLDKHGFAKFCEFMPMRVYHRLDLIEDPVPYDAEIWSRIRERWSARLALDKGWKSASEGFDAVVIKPARRDWRLIAEKFPTHPLVLTSAMDHGLGQMFAAYQAAVAFAETPERISQCGLCTQHLFDSDPFFEQLTSPGGKLQSSHPGTGLGFDEILNTLEWKRLT